MPSCKTCPEEILGSGACLLGSGLMKRASFPAAHSALNGLKPFRIMELWNAGNILLIGISVLQLLKTMYTSATWGRFSHKVASEPREAQRLSPGCLCLCAEWLECLWGRQGTNNHPGLG